MKIEVLYTVSRYTNPNSNYVRHIPDWQGRPMCGQKSRAGFQHQQGEPTCKRCIKAAEVSPYDDCREYHDARRIEDELPRCSRCHKPLGAYSEADDTVQELYAWYPNMDKRDTGQKLYCRDCHEEMSVYHQIYQGLPTPAYEWDEETSRVVEPK
jgi:hypothetical protein